MNLQECAKTLHEYLTENNVHGTACHEAAPEIIADSTPWGLSIAIVKCRNCGNEAVAPGENIVEAFENALSRWNRRLMKNDRANTSTN